MEKANGNSWILEKDRNGNTTYLIALTSNDRFLTDLLVFRPALDLRPVIYGPYAKRMETIKIGMTVNDMEKRLGGVSPVSYRQTKDGKWEVIYSYQGCHLDFWVYHIDAATGIITKAWVSAI